MEKLFSSTIAFWYYNNLDKFSWFHIRMNRHCHCNYMEFTYFNNIRPIIPTKRSQCEFPYVKSPQLHERYLSFFILFFLKLENPRRKYFACKAWQIQWLLYVALIVKQGKTLDFWQYEKMPNSIIGLEVVNIFS